jgi:hypothetical protein
MKMFTKFILNYLWFPVIFGPNCFTNLTPAERKCGGTWRTCTRRRTPARKMNQRVSSFLDCTYLVYLMESQNQLFPLIPRFSWPKTRKQKVLILVRCYLKLQISNQGKSYYFYRFQQKRVLLGSMCISIARWCVLKPKIPIWANFRMSCNGRCWYF